MPDAQRNIHLLILCFALTISISVNGQTPGLIIKPATGAGAAVLDPNGDGYVSQKINGIQKGFTIPPDNDVVQSEIPYVALVRPDVQGDLERGPTGGFTEIVGTDAAGNNAILTYTDGVNLYYRFRLSGYAPNSKSYSILIDTDQKFGYTGINADLDAKPGNPGFEVEIVLETNFNVYAYNVNGSATRPATATASALFDTNCQKSIAVSKAGGDPDYFYDFYLPYPTSLFTKDTPLRYVALTSMNPFPAIGNNAVSDVGGVGSFTNLDQAFIDLVTVQTPTLPGQEVLERSACPMINSVGVSDATISGTTVSGAAVNVYVYQSNGTTLVGSGTATTTGTTWTINKTSIKDALNNSISLVAGYKIKASATAPGFGVSFDNCDIETVADCTVATSIPIAANFSKIGGSKGYTVSPGRPSGTIVYLYTSNYTLMTGTFKNGITNPYSTTTNNQTFSYEFQGGQSFPDGVYYFRYQEPGKCISPYFTSCLYATGTQSLPPTISPTTITTSTTSITGTGSAASSVISIYADGNLLTTTTSAATFPFAWEATVSNLSKCQVITARQVTGTTSCMSDPTSDITVTVQAVAPTILNSGCFISPGTVNGLSTEIDATVTLYKTSPAAATLGTAVVGKDGTWKVTGLTLNNGDVIDAAVTSGPCLTSSVKSLSVTITTPPSISSFPITFNSVTEKQTSVSGTIAGVSSPVTLKLYVDGTFIGSTPITANGNWNVNGINSYDLYVGGKVQATITGTGCESALSTNNATIQCLPPSMPGYTGGSKSYCLGGTGQVALISSETGVIYQLVNAAGVAQGPAVVGTGSGITLFTNALNSNISGIYVKVYKIGSNACAILSSTAINFDIVNPSPSVTFTSNSISVSRGTTSISFPYTAKSMADFYTIDFSLAANNQGFTDITTQTAIPASPLNLTVPAAAATGAYTGTITIYSNSGSCTVSYDFTITVYQASFAPVITVQPENKTICSGTSANLSVAAAGTITGYQWQSSTSYSGTYSDIALATSSNYSTPNLSATTYYRVQVKNGSLVTTSNVATVTVTAAVAAAGAISGTSAVCQGQNGVNYTIAPIANATSYMWTYSGNGAFINGTGSSVFINFGNNATSGNLSVTGINSCGSVTSAPYSITVNLLPVVAAGPDQSTCSNLGAVNITSGASAFNYTTVAWTTSGTNPVSNANSLTDATYTPSAADISAGSVTLTLTATSTCGTATSTKTLTITSAPVATAGDNIIACTGTSAIAMTGAAASGTYMGMPTWSGGSGTWLQNASADLATFTPNTSSGSFTATLTLTGCSNVTSTRTISWGTLPAPTFIIAPTISSCVGSNAIYTTEEGQADYTWTIQGAPGADYSIMGGGVTTNSITIKWLSTGSKTVTVNYKNTEGCLGSAPASNTTTVYANPNPSEIIIH